MSTVNGMGRTLPHSLEAEEHLLSCCMIDSAQAVGKCQEAKLTPASFYDSKHGIIFDIIIDLVARQQPADIMTVAEELKIRRQLDAVGGFPFLTQISSRIPTTAQLTYFVERVAEQDRLRKLIRLGTSLVEECYNFSGEFEFAEKCIGQLADTLNQQTSDRTWNHAVDEALALTRERMKPVEERNTGGLEISWGIRDLDRYFKPIEPGELIVIGGYTSAGKSSLLRQVLWSIAGVGHPVVLETIEVRDTEEAINLAAHISGHRSRARLTELHEKDRETLLASFDKMRVPHFTVCDQDHDLGSMLARARAFKRKHGLKVLGIDYLQIMRDVKKLLPNVRPDFAIGCVTSELKRFATIEGVAVFLLSGFNREYVRAGNREPKLSDLDGSASIEKDASRVVLIDVPTDYLIRGVKYTQSLTADSDDQPSFFTKVIQAKGRNQGTASVGLMFKRETKTFTQVAQ